MLQSAITRFNEAPIHESGKFRLCWGRRLREIGFNEAPIHESGKSIHSRCSISAATASMRPRFMNRGSPEDAIHHGLEVVRFNEAPIHESGK